MNSIRARLLLWQISAVLVTALVVALLTSRLAWEGFNQLRDLGLEQIADTVVRHDESLARLGPAAASASPSNGEDASTQAVQGLPSAKAKEVDQFVSQIWNSHGELISSSRPDGGPPLQSAGHNIQTWRGQSWRIFTLQQGPNTVQVAVTTRLRRADFFSLTPWLLVPLAVLVLGLGLLIHQAVSRAMRPLARLRQDIEQRELSGLHALPTEGLPDEVAPLARTINQLLTRVDHLLASQRRFLADAAHELNTPLAAIKLQAQLARRAQAGERLGALAELDAGIERAIHLSAQLLLLARLEPDARQPVRVPVQLDALMRQAVVAFSAQAEQRQTDLGLLGADAVTLDGNPHALRALLDNLIDNALRYTPAGARIDVSLRAVANQAVLSVSDNGPGIAAAERQHVLERFVRLSPGDGTGSGLGLSIVQEITLQHGASLVLDDTPGGGLTVRISFPLPAAPEAA